MVTPLLAPKQHLPSTGLKKLFKSIYMSLTSICPVSRDVKVACKALLLKEVLHIIPQTLKYYK